jgi:hypothetical protein
MNIRGILIVCVAGLLILPACNKKRDKDITRLEKDMVDQRILETENEAQEEPAKEDYSQGV